MKKNLFVFFFTALVNAGNAQGIPVKNNEPVIINGTMPSVATDSKGILYMVFTRGEKLEYIASSDKGISFSNPIIIDSIKNVFGAAGRGPQIVKTSNGLCVLAPDKNGDIHCYYSDNNGKWKKQGKINDIDAVAKEGFVSAASNGDSIYVAWLDLRYDEKNKIVGTLSVDGGRHWQNNKIIYQSPSGTVCECCKPSVSFTRSGVHVMFRNNIDGNRDLYFMHSPNGTEFNKSQKLGQGNWKLNACPMDGGGIIDVANGNVRTVWRRNDTIFSCIPGQKEVLIGKGKNCVITAAGDNYVYAWIENNYIVCLLPGGKKIIAGKGSLPLIKTINEKEVICVWQSDSNIFSRLISL